jgi:hypothetical protein
MIIELPSNLSVRATHLTSPHLREFVPENEDPEDEEDDSDP